MLEPPNFAGHRTAKRFRNEAYGFHLSWLRPGWHRPTGFTARVCEKMRLKVVFRLTFSSFGQAEGQKMEINKLKEISYANRFHWS